MIAIVRSLVIDARTMALLRLKSEEYSEWIPHRALLAKTSNLLDPATQ